MDPTYEDQQMKNANQFRGWWKAYDSHNTAYQYGDVISNLGTQHINYNSKLNYVNRRVSTSDDQCDFAKYRLRC